MKAFTDRQKVLLYKKNMEQCHVQKPAFFIGNLVKIVDVGNICINEVYIDSASGWGKPIGVWEYLDKIRTERVGTYGRIISMSYLNVRTRPIVKKWSYFVKFKDGAKIVFGESYLIYKVKIINN